MSALARPLGWSSKRLKYLATYNDEVLAESTNEDQEIDYVEISGVSLSRGIEQVERMTFGQAPSRARRKVRSGDVLISTVRTYLRAIAKVDKAAPDLIASTGFCVVRPNDDVDSGFIGWAAKSEPFVSEVVARSVGVSYPAINASELVTIDIPLPPLDTQRRIARFLDEKTARIDGLIEKKRALLDRLAEKRQALITRAVTKGLPAAAAAQAGLNPDAPLKPSGIDWLGDIPAHWEVLPLKRRIERIEQGWSPSADERIAADHEWGVLKSGCVNEGVYDQTSHKALPSLLEPRPELEVTPGNLLMCRASGSLKYIGSVALVRETRPLLMFSDKTYRLTLQESSTDKRFFVYSMAAKHLREQIMLSVSGAEGLANNIAQSSVGRYLHCFPPLGEQIAISAHLDRLAGLLEATRKSVLASIEQLQEYRSALITAAVTGQVPALR